MEIIQDDAYEEMAATYQCLEIDRLNTILKQYGMDDKALRQKICAEYFSCNGYFLDAGTFISQSKQVYPQIAFAERPCDPRRGLGAIETLYVTSASFSFHEYADGDIYWYFDEHNEDVSEIEHRTI
ncbi:MAG: hypothetical protein JOZ57_00390 [Abitibacteriaceae bacterium]|nr:hypothetical protein [Abditibacteriaceae bacterium]